MLIERRKHPRLPHAITMAQAANANHWEAMQKAKWAKLTQEKGRKK